ncbi:MULTISPECIES: pirin family protein [Shewanella]|jgi:redox-sensitive bicupin YhaK (pirin superfamily)|uniref:pirin family protein n=1 Tax=Shewanella TaxID=22 RepID=UPI000C3600CD|nr:MULTISPECIES: pirin family protein [Shewanella]NCQ46403.1 pirin family protein [Shewanella frigidimarina]NCO72300.1 pirin family protein [Shewanella vesiculosa]NCP38392.1 pirin family protein [Shewanella vesiculosa]NCP70329.1 pirin family protein [Shewanella vesiculosa]NCP75756.1 pirin family protein [Shewanella vesiculosa]
MITLRLASERGKANFGWLDSKHSFSFGSYYDPEHMGFSALRVINDDSVTPGAGFATHGHRDMEIISYVLEGSIAHKDSEGNVEVLPAGEFQLMSAGSGISHSEYNASKTESLKFLQIWIQPNTLGNTPGYQQKNFGQAVGLTTIATPTGDKGTLQIKQNATLSQLILAPNSEITYQVAVGRKVYVHQVAGELSIDEQNLSAGDGAKLTDITTVTLVNPADTQSTALIFDLP